MLGGRNANRAKTVQVTAATPAAQETTVQFVQGFIERGGFAFVTKFFTALDTGGLEASTLRNRALSMQLEIVSQLLSSRWSASVKDFLSEQVVFDIFNQNLLVTQNFILALERQQRDFVEGQRQLKSDQHLISVSLMLTQKMMFLHPKLMRVLTDFANIDQVFNCAFLKVDTERIQQKVSQCFLEICKKLDRDLSSVLTADSAEENKNASAAAQVQAQRRLAESIGAELPSVFFFRLFWNQYLGQALLLRKDTGVTKELFNFMTKLMQETELANHLEGIVQPEEFVSGVATMI